MAQVIKPGQSNAYIGHIVYDEVVLKNVHVPQNERHIVPAQLVFVDFVPKVEAKIFQTESMQRQRSPTSYVPKHPLDSWELDGDILQDPIAQSLKFRIASGNISRVANGIHLSAVVYDEVGLKNVALPKLARHEISEEFFYQDFVPK